MSLNVLMPMLLSSASAGLTCGVSCGACGTPVVNVFLAAYLFTHTGKLRKSIWSFAGFHMGKALMSAVLCAVVSWLGSQTVDANGNLLGIHLQQMVYVVMLVFVVVLIVRWFREQKRTVGGHSCSGKCQGFAGTKEGFLPMFFYGLISGMSPCASLMVVLGYAVSLTTVEAVLIGPSFSLANSIVPLILLVILTGVLSKEMFREIPSKIKYFQLMTYLIFAVVLLYNFTTSVFGR